MCAKSFAQTNGITYQAVILNPNGVKTSDLNNSNLPLASKDICMQFKFIDEFSNVEYQEVIKTKTDSYGMVNLIIGTGTQTSGYATSFDKISWDSLDKSLVVGINVSGDCSSFTEISKQPFNYVPFAYSAINAVNVTGVVAIENGGTNATTVLGAKTNLGLQNVDNTTDLNKPISDASKLALDLKEASANKSTNINADGNSDIKFPSVKSVKTYIDASVLSNATALATEVTRATTAENGIAANLVTETNRATTAETTLTTNLATEITRATTAEATKEAAANKSTDGTFATNSDVKFPTEKATKTYVDASASSNSTALSIEVARSTTAENGIAANLVTETNRATTAETTLTTNLATEITRATTSEATKEAAANKSTDGTFATNSDVKFPTEKATKTYVDASASSNSTALATEITRATTAENAIASNLVTETNRATLAEGINATAITTETNRATTAENTIASNLVSETNRATLAEGINATAITTETTRATTAETTLATNLTNEITRATTVEATKEASANKSTDGTFATNSDVKFPTEKATKTYVDASASSNSTALTIEVTRATTAENTIAANLVTETNRATLAEGINATAITTEATRATTAENVIAANLVTETNRATTAETTLTTNLATEITRATTAESTKEATANKSTDGTFATNSDVKFPTEKATKTYVDASASSNSTALATEITRATTAENGIASNLVTETNRATLAEGINATVITTETNRAITAETTLAANLVTETNRATTAETTLATNLATEITRATTAESTKEATANKSTDGTFATNSDVKFPTEKATKTYVDASASSSSTALATEVTRATTAENTIAANLVTETNRATLAETTLATNLAASITLSQTLFDLKAPLESPIFTGTVSGVTAVMVGLGDVDNTSDVNKPVSAATQTALDTKASNADLDLKAPLDSPTFSGTVSGVTAVMVGLGDVDNTSDVNKPVSVATQTALDAKASNTDLDLKAPLESPTFTGTVSGVTAVMVGLGDVDNTSDVNKPVSAATQTALDTKASNADLDLKAPLESPTFTGTVSGVTAVMVGLGDVDNTSDANKPVSAATQTALDTKASNADLDLKAPLESPTFTGAPLAPTATAGISTTQIATTEFVTDAIATVSANTSTNFVDLTTNQTIAGTKVFSSDATINGVTIGRGKFNENSNTAIGLGALESNAGYANTGIGRGALALNDNGNGNTALGYIALSNNVSGGNNVSIGGSTLLNNISGSQNTAIGNNADVGSDGITNSVAIGANAIVTASNTIQLGSDGSGSFSAITDVKTSGNLTAAGYKIPSGTASQYLMADGTVSTGAVPVREIADEFTATAAVINFTLSQAPSTNSKVKMYVNGIRISNSAYSWTGTTLTYIPANNGSYTLSVNDRIQFDYFY